MKTIIQLFFIITVLVSPGLVRAQSVDSIDPSGQMDPYAEGLVAEERHQDYAKATEYYESVIQEFDAQRQEAAHAIFRLGECLRMLGQTEAAKVQYARILREFPDFVPLTKQSHTRLIHPKKTERVKQDTRFPFDAMDRYGLISEFSDQEKQRFENFLFLTQIDYPLTYDSKLHQVGFVFDKEDLSSLDTISEKMYEGIDKATESSLRVATLKANGLSPHIDLNTIGEQLKTLDHVFMPILPQFFSGEIDQKWKDANPDVYSNSASELGIEEVQATVDVRELSHSERVARMETARSLVLQIFTDAGNNNGNIPETLNEVIRNIRQSAYNEQTLDRLETYGPDFDLVQTGKLDDLKGILLKDKRIWKNPEGQFVKIYGFTDGSIQVIPRSTMDDILKFEEQNIASSNAREGEILKQASVKNFETQQAQDVIFAGNDEVMHAVQQFLEDLEIDLPVRYRNRYKVYGLWFDQGDTKQFSRVAQSLYQQQDENPSEELARALMDYNSLENVSIDAFKQEINKLEKVFLPLLPQYFSDKAKNAWPDIASMHASEVKGLFFTILGQIANPDVYQIQPDQTLGIVEAIAKAGGFTPNAKPNRISRFRNGEEKLFDFDELLKRKELDDAMVKPGDRIVVPARFF